MPILLFRVDERLIHGQVVIGWGNQLRPDRYLVVDDDLAASDWEKDLYRLAVPEGCAIEFHDVAGAREHLVEWSEGPERSVLLTRGVAAMLGMAQGGGMKDKAVNLGGLHYGPGRDEILSYVYLDDEDRQQLIQLSKAGADVSARDLPGSHRVPLSELLS